MAVDAVITSPHRRNQPHTAFSTATSKKQYSSRGGDEMGSWSTLFQRHRFLLTALALLAFLCTVYLYFAITLGAAGDFCSEFTGTRKVTCLLEQAKASAIKGKMKFF